MTHRVYVDRLEDRRAVLVCGAEGNQTISLPRNLLPPDTREGDALDLTFTPAPQDTTRAEIQSLMDDLFS